MTLQNAVGTAVHRAGANETDQLGSWVLQNVRSGAIGGAILGAIFSIIPMLGLIAGSGVAIGAGIISWFVACFVCGFASNALGNAIHWWPKHHEYGSGEAFLNNIIGYAILLALGGL